MDYRFGTSHFASAQMHHSSEGVLYDEKNRITMPNNEWCPAATVTAEGSLVPQYCQTGNPVLKAGQQERKLKRSQTSSVSSKRSRRHKSKEPSGLALQILDTILSSGKVLQVAPGTIVRLRRDENGREEVVMEQSREPAEVDHVAQSPSAGSP